MLIGYARTSTAEQEAGLEAQLKQLKQLGCEKVFAEQIGATGTRPQLGLALEFSRSGDTLVVTKLDRLARSVRHLGEILELLQCKGAALRILDLSIDTNTATGKLMLNVIGSVAQFEREMMLERQREGIAKAKAEGKYKGRYPSARSKAGEILSLARQGVRKTQIAEQLGIGRSSVYRVLTNTKDF